MPKSWKSRGLAKGLPDSGQRAVHLLEIRVTIFVGKWINAPGLGGIVSWIGLTYSQTYIRMPMDLKKNLERTFEICIAENSAKSRLKILPLPYSPFMLSEKGQQGSRLRGKTAFKLMDCHTKSYPFGWEIFLIGFIKSRNFFTIIGQYKKKSHFDFWTSSNGSQR